MKQYRVPNNEEGIANAFEYFREGGKFAGPVGRAFERIRQFLERLGNALRGLGFQSIEDIFASVEAGTVGGAVRKGSMADLASMTLEGYKAMPESYRAAVRDDLNAVLEKFHAVYHGTPHIWPPEPGFPHGRPRLDKIGTGEGAQAYGWGWYSAETEGVGKSYAVGRQTGGTFKAGGTGPFADVEMLDVSKPNLYRLDIPDDVLPKLLDWDRPLSEQPRILNAVNRGKKQGEGQWFGSISGAGLYQGLADQFGGPTGNYAQDMARTTDGRKAASEYLASIDIVGNRYLDQQSRGKEGGTYNYVIWDQPTLDRIALLERNGEKLDAMREEEKFSLGRNLPPNVTVIEKQGSKDKWSLPRFVVNPKNAFYSSPVLRGTQKFATEIETFIASTQHSLTKEYNEIRNRFRGDKEGWETLTDTLWVGEADEVEFTEDQLRNDLGWTDPKIIQAYKDFRTLVEKMGRFVDMHRRSMLPKYRARKTAILERMRTITAMDDKLFRSLYGRRSRLRVRARAAAGTDQALLDTLDDIERQMQGIREQTQEYADLLDEVDRLDGILAATSIRTKVGYLPHKFFGTWAVYKLVEQPVLDKDGKPTLDDAGAPVTETVHHLVAGTKHGFHPDQRSATAASERVAIASPEDQFVVRAVQFKFPNSAATTLTDASYWTTMAKVSKITGLAGQDLHDVMGGVIRRRFRRRIAGFTQQRKGVEGFSTDMDKIMRAHISEVTRYVYLDKFKYRAINDMEKIGMSPFRSANQQYPVLTSMMDAYIRDMNGQKQPMEGSIDEVIDKTLSKPWGKAALIGFPALGSGVTALAGISTNPFAAGLIAGWVGYTMYRGLAQDTEFKSRAITQVMVSDMSHLKLGMVFNLGSAVVNMTQTINNTLPVLKPKYTAIGIAKTGEAVRSWASWKLGLREAPNEDWRLLQRSDTFSNDTYTEQQLMAIIQHKAAFWSMLPFRTTENTNRAVAFLGAYHRAKDRGALPGPAFKEAEATMGFTQHRYGASSKAELLRNTFVRVPAIFKNYMFQQIAFTFELGRKGVTGESIYDEEVQIDRDAILWHLTSLFLTAGALGLPFVTLLGSIIKWVSDWDPIEELKKAALAAQAKGELVAAAWLTFARGLPAYALGEDMSARAGMGEQFTPSQATDLLGPWFSSWDKARSLGELQAGVVDQLYNLSPGFGKPLKAIEASANGMPIFPTAFTEREAFANALADNKIAWINPWKNRPDFTEQNITKTDLLRMAVGSTPTKVSMARDEWAGDAKDIALERKKTSLYVNRIVSAVRTYGHNEAKLDAALNKIQADMERAGVDVSETTIKRALESAQKPRLQRTIEGAPKKMRGDIADRAQPLLQQERPSP
ncbi:MAG: hypothetical protein Q8P46_18670, partial [Hyphomicrobiales bacterium]|nr:hypothetical protein [Hyphomicrobiales bacterium]